MKRALKIAASLLPLVACDNTDKPLDLDSVRSGTPFEPLDVVSTHAEVVEVYSLVPTEGSGETEPDQLLEVSDPRDYLPGVSSSGQVNDLVALPEGAAEGRDFYVFPESGHFERYQGVDYEYPKQPISRTQINNLGEYSLIISPEVDLEDGAELVTTLGLQIGWDAFRNGSLGPIEFADLVDTVRFQVITTLGEGEALQCDLVEDPARPFQYVRGNLGYHADLQCDPVEFSEVNSLVPEEIVILGDFPVEGESGQIHHTLTDFEIRITPEFAISTATNELLTSQQYVRRVAGPLESGRIDLYQIPERLDADGFPRIDANGGMINLPSYLAIAENGQALPVVSAISSQLEAGWRSRAEDELRTWSPSVINQFYKGYRIGFNALSNATGDFHEPDMLNISTQSGRVMSQRCIDDEACFVGSGRDDFISENDLEDERCLEYYSEHLCNNSIGFHNRLKFGVAFRDGTAIRPDEDSEEPEDWRYNNSWVAVGVNYFDSNSSGISLTTITSEGGVVSRNLPRTLQDNGEWRYWVDESMAFASVYDSPGFRGCLVLPEICGERVVGEEPIVCGEGEVCVGSEEGEICIEGEVCDACEEGEVCVEGEEEGVICLEGEESGGAIWVLQCDPLYDDCVCEFDAPPESTP